MHFTSAACGASKYVRILRFRQGATDSSKPLYTIYTVWRSHGQRRSLHFLCTFNHDCLHGQLSVLSLVQSSSNRNTNKTKRNKTKQNKQNKQNKTQKPPCCVAQLQRRVSHLPIRYLPYGLAGSAARFGREHGWWHAPCALRLWLGFLHPQ